MTTQPGRNDWPDLLGERLHHTNWRREHDKFSIRDGATQICDRFVRRAQPVSFVRCIRSPRPDGDVFRYFAVTRRQTDGTAEKSRAENREFAKHRGAVVTANTPVGNLTRA